MIDLTKNGDVWITTLNRPDKANALTTEMLMRLIEIAKDARAAKVLIVTGTGNVFSAGADLDAARAGLAVSPLWEELSGEIASLPGLTIAALNGSLAGGAFGMALACDLRIAVPEAKFFYPVMKLGFLPQPSDPVRMARLVGPSRTKMILMSGQSINAATAVNWGLIDEIANKDSLTTRALQLGSDASNATYSHVKSIKSLI